MSARPADPGASHGARFTVIVPYYRQPLMLQEQLNEFKRYPEGFRFIVVDDGSKEPAEPIVRSAEVPNLELYRVDVDIPWNRGGARNLGSRMAQTKWIIHLDTDHILPAECAARLLAEPIMSSLWYRFPRFRRGKADDTRKKDKIPADMEFGKIHPHIDSYLCRRELYWRVGGYDEDYSGCLGGGTPFLKQMERLGRVSLLPDSVFLVVYTRDACADASVDTLSRDTAEFTRRRKVKEAQKNTIARNPIRFPWSRQL